MLTDVILRVRALFRSRIVDQEIDDELRFHLDRQVETYEKGGLSHREALRRARLDFGGVDQVKEDYRDALGVRIADQLGRNVRVAIRSLWSAPTVSIVALLSLALGIGANTAIFSIVDSLILRPLPVHEPQQLAVLTGGTPVPPGLPPLEGYTYAIWEAVRPQAALSEQMCAWSTMRFDLATGGEQRPVQGLLASGNFFATLGVPAFVGRTFTDADDVRGGGSDGPVAVISYAFWQRQFGGAAHAIGTALVIERVPFTVIGVTPPAFLGLEVGRDFDVAVPLTADALLHARDTLLDIPSWDIRIMVRLRHHDTVERATAIAREVQPQIRQMAAYSFAIDFLKSPFTLVPAASGVSGLRRQYQYQLLLLFVIVALVLVIACANIANLLLARALARRHEWSLRLALGASRWDLARQRFVESLLLSTVGAGLGILFAGGATRVLVAQLSTSVTPVALDLSLNWRVLAFTGAVAMTTALLFGVAPAFRVGSVTSMEIINAHARRTENHWRVGPGAGLVIAQMAFSLVLVVVAGLLVRTFMQLASVPLGFDAARVLLVNINGVRAHMDPARRVSLYLQLTQAVAAVPGVADAGGSLTTPVSGLSSLVRLDLPGASISPDRPLEVPAHFITPGWLAAYGTRLRSGRDFEARDAMGAPTVALVNEAFVHLFLPNTNPLGVTTSRGTIVGVVGDAVYRDLRDPLQPIIYLPLAQAVFPYAVPGISISLRAALDASGGLTNAVATALTKVDRDVTFSFRPLMDQIDASMAPERVVAILSAFFGGLALALAALGLFGITSYAISRRRVEIGIRLALGATPRGVVRLVLSRALLHVALGITIGGVLSAWASQLIASLLYHIEPYDAITWVSAVVVLTSVAGLASALPARRAARIEPAVALRES